MKEEAYIYFLTNAHNNVLYIGVTHNIIRRVAEHKAKINKGFTYRYNCEKLVYYEIFSLIIDAIAREKQLKNWKREWKNTLVDDFNPEWKDMSKEIGVTDELIVAIKEHYQEIAGQARNDDRIQADQKAESEYDEFNKTQKIISDFDRQVLDEMKTLQLNGNENDNEK